MVDTTCGLILHYLKCLNTIKTMNKSQNNWLLCLSALDTYVAKIVLKFISVCVSRRKSLSFFDRCGKKGLIKQQACDRRGLRWTYRSHSTRKWYSSSTALWPQGHSLSSTGKGWGLWYRPTSMAKEWALVRSLVSGTRRWVGRLR